MIESHILPFPVIYEATEVLERCERCWCCTRCTIDCAGCGREGETEEESAVRALGLDHNADVIACAEAKRKQFVRESAELYASQSGGDSDGTEEEGEEEVENEG